MSADDRPTHEEFAEGATTLTEALDELAGLGFDTEFRALADGIVRCGNCGQTFEADPSRVAGERRLEGASDPDDMQLVLGIVCPHCDHRGVLVLGYGPMGDEISQDVLLRVK